MAGFALEFEVHAILAQRERGAREMLRLTEAKGAPSRLAARLRCPPGVSRPVGEPGRSPILGTERGPTSLTNGSGV